MNRISRLLSITILLVGFLFACNQKDTKFGKQYNSVRLKYGSPIIHDYLLCQPGKEFEVWSIPREIEDTILTGFHVGKGFHVYGDSTLEEDDIFRKRINDSTFVSVVILTNGNQRDFRFGVSYDTVDAREILEKDYFSNAYPQYNHIEITIEKADSILNAWGTSRFK